MAILQIVTVPDERLRRPTTKIGRVDAQVRQLIASMRETMVAAHGVGLAAPQVGVARRLIVVGIPPEHDDDHPAGLQLTLINPELVRFGGEQTGDEGCLSIPGWAGEVTRYDRVTVRALDPDGKEVRIKARAYLARVLQHEIDHLDGILFTDRMKDPTALRPVDTGQPVDAQDDVLV
ncbi:MAG: peptide deformylase [Chloroflexi bacterium]|nr:peptide deformylase [Chloroflexota bacterium]